MKGDIDAIAALPLKPFFLHLNSEMTALAVAGSRGFELGELFRNPAPSDKSGVLIDGEFIVLSDEKRLAYGAPCARVRLDAGIIRLLLDKDDGNDSITLLYRHRTVTMSAFVLLGGPVVHAVVWRSDVGLFLMRAAYRDCSTVPDVALALAAL